MLHRKRNKLLILGESRYFLNRHIILNFDSTTVVVCSSRVMLVYPQRHRDIRIEGGGACITRNVFNATDEKNEVHI